jgi:hypothetical protein
LKREKRGEKRELSSQVSMNSFRGVTLRCAIVEKGKKRGKKRT